MIWVPEIYLFIFFFKFEHCFFCQFFSIFWAAYTISTLKNLRLYQEFCQID